MTINAIIPPHSDDAEQNVLGALLTGHQAALPAIDLLSRSDFFRLDSGIIFEAIKYLASRDKNVDAVTVADYLESINKLDNVGGLEYIGGLAKSVASISSAENYAIIVRNKAIRRQILEKAEQIRQLAYSPDETDAVLDQAQTLIGSVQFLDRNSTKIAKDWLRDSIDMLEERFNAGGEIIGIDTGFDDLNKLTAGLQKSNLIIIAGRPSMGKTTLAMNLAEHVSLKLGQPVFVQSMEMEATALIDRCIASTQRIDLGKIKSGNLDDSEWPKITAAASMIANAPLWIDQEPMQTVYQIRAKARKVHKENPLSLIVIDYLQLMHSDNKDNRNNEISEITRGLKALAKELNVPVIALSQLNRGLENRPNKRPRMADLRESGAIEQDADLIMFVYRDEVYDEDSPDKGTAEIIIGKQRDGATGSVRLTFQGRYVRFDNYIGPSFTEEPDQSFKNKYGSRNKTSNSYKGFE